MREAGWNQVAADWEIFRALGTVYAARAGRPRGRDRGDAALRRVRLDQHGAGRGRASAPRARHAAAEALHRRSRSSRAACPCSMPRRQGRPLYRALGFEETWGYHRLVRAEGAAPCAPACRCPAAPPSVRSPMRTGTRFAPMTPRRSAPTAARCCDGCAGGCRLPNWSPTRRWPHRGLPARPRRPQRVADRTAGRGGRCRGAGAAGARDPRARRADLYRSRRQQDRNPRLARASAALRRSGR